MAWVCEKTPQLFLLTWLRCWNLMTSFWPHRLQLLRDLIYVFIGCVMLFVAEKWIPLADIDEERSDAWAKGISPFFSLKIRIKKPKSSLFPKKEPFSVLTFF